MVEIEYEMKALLSEGQHTDISDYFTSQGIAGHSKIQVNYYYDTSDFSLCSLGDTLRIRQKDQELKLEYKHMLANENTRSSAEYTCAVKRLQKKIILSDYLDADDFQSGNSCFTLLGCLITHRQDYLQNDLLISLDKNIYLGMVDYELEVEAKSDTPIDHFLTIPLSSTSTSKYARFVQCYRKIYLAGK